jgi:aminoglycoside phosphotransferase (APT) family kinase protein
MSDLVSRDTAPIRPGEELDAGALEKYLRAHLPHVMPVASLGAAAIHIEQFPAGHSNLTYLVRLGGHEFVLRRPPSGPIAPKAHDMPRECRLLAALHPHFPLAPRPYWLCEDTSVIGAPFYLMERRRGLIIRWHTPEEIGNNFRLRRQVSEAMVDSLASLHAIDINSSGLSAIGNPVGFVARQVRGWTERWHRAKTNEVPELDQVADWLAERIPPEPGPSAGRPATLVHNDFKLDNVMLDPRDPARVVAVLDWEMCTVGDPLMDVGILLCYWVEKDDPDIRRESFGSVTTERGWMTRREIIERYAEKTGRGLASIAFYQVFALFKTAVAIQQIYLRYVCGLTRDERFKNFDRQVQGLARVALDLARRSGL